MSESLNKTLLLILAAFSLGVAGWMMATRNEAVRQLESVEVARDNALATVKDLTEKLTAAESSATELKSKISTLETSLSETASKLTVTEKDLEGARAAKLSAEEAVKKVEDLILSERTRLFGPATVAPPADGAASPSSPDPSAATPSDSSSSSSSSTSSGDSSGASTSSPDSGSSTTSPSDPSASAAPADDPAAASPDASSSGRQRAAATPVPRRPAGPTVPVRHHPRKAVRMARIAGHRPRLRASLRHLKARRPTVRRRPPPTMIRPLRPSRERSGGLAPLQAAIARKGPALPGLFLCVCAECPR